MSFNGYTKKTPFSTFESETQKSSTQNLKLSNYEVGQAILNRNNIVFAKSITAKTQQASYVTKNDYNNEVFIPNIKEIHINKPSNNVYLENVYPVPINNFRDKKICEYLTLLILFNRSPYISEDSGLSKVDTINKNLMNSAYCLKFQFTPTGNENIKNTDNAILIFQGMLNSLYQDDIESTLTAIQNKEKEIIQNKIQAKDASLKNINIPELYNTIDSINADDVKSFLSKYIISQPPIIFFNEGKNPYKNN